LRRTVPLTVKLKNYPIIKQSLKMLKHYLFQLILRKIHSIYWANKRFYSVPPPPPKFISVALKQLDVISWSTAVCHSLMGRWPDPRRAWAAWATVYSGPPNHASYFDSVF
jgi:hypothetical protein